MLVLNKIDLVDEVERRARLEAERAAWPEGTVVGVSARTGEGLEELRRALDQSPALEPVSEARFHFGVEEGDKVSFLHEHGRVVKADYTADGVEVEAVVSESVRRRLGGKPG